MNDVDALEDMLRVALPGPAQGCGAHNGDCPCRMIWLTDNLGYPTLNCEELSEPMRKEDIRALCACRNAAPALIALVRAAERIVAKLEAVAEINPSLHEEGIMADVAEFQALQERGFFLLPAQPPKPENLSHLAAIEDVRARNKM